MLSVACRDPTSGLDQNDEVSCMFLGLMHISVVIYSHTCNQERECVYPIGLRKMNV